MVFSDLCYSDFTAAPRGESLVAAFSCVQRQALADSMPKLQDQHHMAEALQQAQLAAQQQEVPIGAILVFNKQVIARAHNLTEQTKNPTAHAEMLCIQQAAGAVGGWRLLESTLYVTLEPCPMCAGALLQSRVGTVVYGAKNTLLGWLCTFHPHFYDTGEKVFQATGLQLLI